MRFEIEGMDRPVLSDLLSDLLTVCDQNILFDRVIAIDGHIVRAEIEIAALRSYREKIWNRVTELSDKPAGE